MGIDMTLLIMVLARLIREGWLSLEELEGLNEEKLVWIRQILQLGTR
jgi:hypothetical protein